MVALYRTLIVCLTIVFSSPLIAVEIEARLDAPKISAGDTVELTVTINEQVFNSEPDFSVLKQDFDILSKRQSSQYSMINGRITSTTSWILTLLPKRVGYVAVPSLIYDDVRSKPLKLHVEKRKNVNPKSTNELLFLDASVDKKEVYVQEQLIYTIRVFRSAVELYDPSFSAPHINDAVMEQLGDRRKYRSSINGRSYEVIEFRYAVFPQKSGDISIPPAELLATIFQTNRRGFGRDPFNGKQIRKLSPEFNIKVQPKPSNYPTDKPWLPARSLQLTETWAPESSTIKIGEPITRSIVLEADGLVDTLLPPIPAPSLQGIKVYPEQANTSSHIGAQGMVSKRIESQAIIATKLGNVEIPRIDITWWDVNERAVKVTSLPERTMNVTGSTAASQTDARSTAPASLADSSEGAPVSLQQAQNANATWQWIALGTIALWLLTILALAWVVYRNKSKALKTSVIESFENSFSNSEHKAAQNQLKAACEQQNAKQTREALIALFRQHWKDNSIKNLDHIADRSNNEPLTSAFNNLEKSLYKDDGNSEGWDSRFLMSAVNEVMNTTQSKSKDRKLAPLYPT